MHQPEENCHHKKLSFHSVDGKLVIGPSELYSLRDSVDICVLDVRETYLSYHKRMGLNNIMYIPLSELHEKHSLIQAGKLCILVDAAGLRSKEAYLLLRELGYTQLAILGGGMIEWERAGLPVVTDRLEQLDGSCMCQLKGRSRD